MVDEKPPRHPKEKLPGKNPPDPLVLASRQKRASHTRKISPKKSSRSSR